MKQPEKGKMHVLSIGIKYPGGAEVLDGNGNSIGEATELSCTVNDSKAIMECFVQLADKEGRSLGRVVNMNDVDYPVSSEFYPTSNNIKAQIDNIGDTISDNDILVVFISSHGYSPYKDKKLPYSRSADYRAKACLITKINTQYASLYKCTDIYDYIDKLKGKKCMLIDFCFGGSMIAENNVSFDTRIYSSTKNSINAISDLLFSDTKVQQDLDFFILTASKPYEESFEVSTLLHGKFTYAVLGALGWDFSQKKVIGSIAAKVLNQITLHTIAEKAENIINTQLKGDGASQHMKITGSSEDLVLFDFN